MTLDDDMLTPTGYPPAPNNAADMAHSTHSTQPALRPHYRGRLSSTPPSSIPLHRAASRSYTTNLEDNWHIQGPFVLYVVSQAVWVIAPSQSLR